jgi:hypothetical protein
MQVSGGLSEGTVSVGKSDSSQSQPLYSTPYFFLPLGVKQSLYCILISFILFESVVLLLQSSERGEREKYASQLIQSRQNHLSQAFLRLSEATVNITLTPLEFYDHRNKQYTTGHNTNDVLLDHRVSGRRPTFMASITTIQNRFLVLFSLHQTINTGRSLCI